MRCADAANSPASGFPAKVARWRGECSWVRIPSKCHCWPIGGQFVEFRVDAVEPGLYFLRPCSRSPPTIQVSGEIYVRQRIVFIVHQGAFKSSPGFVVFRRSRNKRGRDKSERSHELRREICSLGSDSTAAAKINHGLRRIAGLKRATASLNIASDLQRTATRYKDKRPTKNKAQ